MPFRQFVRRNPLLLVSGGHAYAFSVAQTFLSAVSQVFPACESLETGNAVNQCQRPADSNVRATIACICALNRYGQALRAPVAVTDPFHSTNSRIIFLNFSIP